MKIPRTVNFPGLVLELGGNKTTALELLREALSNAKDHKAGRLFVRIRRDAQGRVSVILIDDGEGLNEERWRAFWGAAWSAKTGSAVGYKGFGTKLFFRCGRLSVASRTSPGEPWLVVTADRPYENDEGAAGPQENRPGRMLRGRGPLQDEIDSR